MTQPKATVNFPATFYLAHLYLILHILTGIGLESYTYLTTGHYRVMAMATWPWTLSGEMVWLVFSIGFHIVAIGHLAIQIRGRLSEYPVRLQNVFIFSFYFLSLLLQLIRFLAWIIGV